MGTMYEAHIYCKNIECSEFKKQQSIRFKKLEDFYGNKPIKCPVCGSVDVSYSSANEIGIGMTVRETIEILKQFSPDSILTLDIEEGTCENGTCIESIENYPYEFFEVDGKDEVKILYSSNKN
jgi:hypothetical protein